MESFDYLEDLFRPRTDSELWQEHCDYEANADYDYQQEAFGDLGEDVSYLQREEAERVRLWVEDKDEDQAFAVISSDLNTFWTPEDDEIPF